ncbi:aminophospholipid translocase [Rhodotorula kratochvilovae]
MEVIKFLQAAFINSDLNMYNTPTDTRGLCRTSSLVEVLSQIEYIFSDKHDVDKVIGEFLTLLATFHTAIPGVKDEKIVSQASSPDEAALVQGADLLSYTFTTRKPQSVFVTFDGRQRQHQVLNILKFDLTWKRICDAGDVEELTPIIGVYRPFARKSLSFAFGKEL